MTYTQGLRRRMFWALSALAAATLLAACSGSSAGAGGATTKPAAGPVTVKVVLKDNLFEPATLSVPVGAEVTLELENQGAALHNLVVETFTSPMMNAGDKASMKVKFTKAGEYKFLCAFHQPGMDGVITAK